MLVCVLTPPSDTRRSVYAASLFPAGMFNQEPMGRVLGKALAPGKKRIELDRRLLGLLAARVKKTFSDNRAKKARLKKSDGAVCHISTGAK